MSVRPAKTQISLGFQISLGIRPVWSESSLCAQWIAKNPSFLHVDSEDSDQTGRMPRLIWVFAGRTALGWFCHEVAQLYFWFHFFHSYDIYTGYKRKLFIWSTTEYATANNRICNGQQQNILLKCAYFVVVINNRMHIFIAFFCWSCHHSVDHDNKNWRILIKYSVVGCSTFCCWSNGQLALVLFDLVHLSLCYNPNQPVNPQFIICIY